MGGEEGKEWVLLWFSGFAVHIFWNNYFEVVNHADQEQHQRCNLGARGIGDDELHRARGTMKDERCGFRSGRHKRDKEKKCRCLKNKEAFSFLVFFLRGEKIKEENCMRLGAHHHLCFSIDAIHVRRQDTEYDGSDSASCWWLQVGRRRRSHDVVENT